MMSIINFIPMRTTRFSLFIFISLFAFGLQAQSNEEIFRAVGTPHNPKVQISFNQYYTAEGLAELGKKIAEAHPELVRRQSIGKSTEGRDIWLLAITD